MAKDLLKRSLLYRELKAEHDEILKHRLLRSQTAGHDVDFDFAIISWKLKHSSQWRRERRSERLNAFEI